MTDRFFDEAFLRKLETLALLYHRAATSQLQGERRSTKRGQSVEFSDFRPYTIGDDFRRIDWNAYARLDRLFIKLFVEEEDIIVHLLIDASRSMNWGQPAKLEYATRIAGALGYVALVKLDRVTASVIGNGSTAAGNHLPPRRGRRSALSLFSFLQVISTWDGLSSERGPESWLNTYAAGARQPGPLLLFSDLMDEGWYRGLNNLGGRGFEVSVIHVLSPDEVNPELSGDFKLIDSESHSEIDVTADFETLERYRRGLDEWQDTWRRFCRVRGMHYVPVVTSQPLEDLLFSRLPRQGVLK
jgi:uncharacterized protein (DUF58 family)